LHANPQWGEQPKHRQAATIWQDQSEFIHLTWQSGALILDHRARQ
jgi:hypothetical protein